MRELVSDRKPPQNSFRRFIRRKETGWESGFPLATLLSMLIMAASGPSQMMGQAPPSRFPFLAVQKASTEQRQVNMTELFLRSGGDECISAGVGRRQP